MKLYIPNEHFLFICDIAESDLRYFRDMSWNYNVVISKRVFAQVFSRDGSDTEMRVLLTIDHDMLFLSTSMGGKVFEVAMYLPEDTIYRPDEAVRWLREHGATEQLVGTCNVEQLLHAYARGKGWNV